MLNLQNIKKGKQAIVIGIEAIGPIRRRLMDMGITKGTTVIVKKVAPLGDPIEITVRGYELSLRKSEAEKIIVEYLI